jgi:hypothetical protein
LFNQSSITLQALSIPVPLQFLLMLPYVLTIIALIVSVRLRGVINMQDDVDHPCQAMADLFTLMELFGRDLRRSSTSRRRIGCTSRRR